MTNEYREKLQSIAAPRRSGSQRTREERVDNVILRTTEHWDGRQDVAVRPDTARYKANRHKTGSKKGQVAEITREK